MSVQIFKNKEQTLKIFHLKRCWNNMYLRVEKFHLINLHNGKTLLIIKQSNKAHILNRYFPFDLDKELNTITLFPIRIGLFAQRKLWISFKVNSNSGKSVANLMIWKVRKFYAPDEYLTWNTLDLPYCHFHISRRTLFRYLIRIRSGIDWTLRVFSNLFVVCSYFHFDERLINE